MRAGASAVAVPPAVARLDSATIHSSSTSSGSAQSSTRRNAKWFLAMAGSPADDDSAEFTLIE
jgi:hypothetical protein